MKSKRGYTIMEAVIAMFLVVVMVGAVFSALMSSRRAIVASSEREEVLYSLQSAYEMIRDCRSNPDCHLMNLGCDNNVSPTYPTTGDIELKSCTGLFTFNFGNLCKDSTENSGFRYKIGFADDTIHPQALLYGNDASTPPDTPSPLPDFDELQIQATCREQL